jgi:hypothetical protein
MKALLTFAAITSFAVSTAKADVLWYIAVADMDNVDCWNVETCGPVSAMVDLTLFGPNTEVSIPANIYGPAGNPPVWGIQLEADAQLPGGPWLITSLDVGFEGPGFAYTYQATYSSDITEGFIYTPGIAFPPDGNETIDPADGCYIEELPLEWTWDNFPDGEIGLSYDFVVNDGETLVIDPGMNIFTSGDFSITINGTVDGNGTAEEPIMLDGDGWEGLVVGATGNGSIEYAMITGVANDDMGGAVTVDDGNLTLRHCIIANNTTTGMGGGVFATNGGVALLFSCTVDHNTATDGGNGYADTESSIGGYYNIFSNGTPNTFVAVDTEVSSLQFTNFFPLGDLNPAFVPYSCDPGFVDPMNGDFYPSYWSVDDPSEINCIIDVAVDPELVDPDGTPLDMGAIPFDQHDILHGAMLVGVEDRVDDQGGFVMVHFDASWNDGNSINPVTQYSIWIHYPGMMEDEWVAAGTVAAMGDADMTYVAQIATLDDQYEGMENIHNFMVGTHSVWFPEAIPSNVMSGFSVDNIAPMPVAGLGDGGWYYDAWPPEYDNVDLSWAPSTDNDFDHYEVYASLTNDFAGAELVYEGTALSTTWTVEFGTLGENDPVYFWAVAIDEHMNAADASEYTVMYEDVQTALPASFELAQNHPNPFNPTTSIAYALPQAADVSLKVFNMTGAEVATLVQGAQAAGNYTVNFDASSLASGVYVYRIEAGSFTDVKKMVLVK